jgi:chromate transport protein ChrA
MHSPITAICLFQAVAYGATTALPAMGPMVNGLTAVVVGLLLATTYRLGKPTLTEPLTWGIALAALVLGAFLAISAALMLVAAGLLETLLLSHRKETRP